MTDFRIVKPAATSAPAPRFAVGAATGSLYFVTRHAEMHLEGLVLIGKNGVTAGGHYHLALDELLPPGTVIEITV